jgi:hypothetical protein
VYPWDEPEIINPAINVLRYGDYRPARFAYGPMNGYLHAAWGALTFVRGLEKGEFPDGIWALTSNRDTAWYWSITSSFFLREARVLSVLIGMLTIIFVFAAALKLGGVSVALWAASVVALSRTSLIQTSMVTADATAMCTTAIVLWSSGHIYANRERWAYVTAAVFAGLTMAFKYTSFPAVFFPVLAHVLAVFSRKEPLLERRLFWFAFVCAISLALFLFPVFLQPTRFLHDLSTEALYYGPSSQSSVMEYFVGFLRGFLVTVDAASGNDLLVPSGLLLLGVLLWGFIILAQSNLKLLLLLALPALLNVHFVAQHASHFFARNLLLSTVSFAIIGGYGFASIAAGVSHLFQQVHFVAKPKFVQPGIYIVCFLPLLIWSFRNAVEQHGFVDPRVKLVEQMKNTLPKGTRVAIASETRWYLNHEEMKNFRITDSPILRMLMDPPTTSIEYLVLPREITFFRPTPLKEEFGGIINAWLKKANPEPGFEFGKNRMYFGKPSIDPAVRLVKNTPALWKQRLITTDKIFGTEFTAGSRNVETKLSDEGLAIRVGMWVSAGVHISKPMTKITINARGLSPFKQDVTPGLRIEFFPASAPNGSATATADFSLFRSQAGLLDYTSSIDLPEGDYIVRMRGSDPEDYRIEVALIVFS